MAGRIQGKNVLVAGATGRQGTAVATLFATEGASLFLAALDPAAGALAERLRQTYGTAVRGTEADLTQEADVERVVAEAREFLGRIDVLYNNLGGYVEPGESPADWDRTMAMNIRSHFLTARAVIPLMKEAGGGAIVEVAAARVARMGGGASYAASKGGIIAMAQNLARHHRQDNIRVNVIAPNNIQESPHPDRPGLTPRLLDRVGQPEDVAWAALFLVSDEAAWVSGAVLNVDGGRDAS